MDQVQLHTFSTSEEAVRMAAKALSASLAQHRKTDVLFLSSGGSAFSILPFVDAKVFGEYVTVGVLDERLSIDPSVNNFLQLVSYMPQHCPRIDSVPKTGEIIGDFADRVDGQIKQWRADHPNGAIIITQGIGADGHTAGILPFPENPTVFGELFIATDRCAVGYDATGKSPFALRTTVTLAFLRDVDISLVYVCGKDKKAALEKTLAPDGFLSETPARVIREMKHVEVFTDI